MSKNNRKLGLSNKNFYDLSQSGLAIRHIHTDKEQTPNSGAQESSYNMTPTSGLDVIKRIKMR